MATEKRLIDANDFITKYCASCGGGCDLEYERCATVIDLMKAPTVDAVEVSRLGKLGQLMILYTGCPRGMIGERGEDGTDSCHLTELDAITDVDGNRWIPVLENDLSRLKAKVDAVEVVHGRWELHGNDDDCGCSYFCSNCHKSYDEEWFYVHGQYRHWNHCPNCGADMRGEGK